jgi:hypothetical protein
MKHDREHRSENATCDCSPNAFETAPQRPGDVRLQDDQGGEEQPVAVVDVQNQNEPDIKSGDDRHACSVPQHK